MFSTVIDIPPDVGIQKQLTNMHVKEWLREDVFQFRWWLLIGLIVIFVVVWWIMIDKSRLLEICLFAALATIVVMGINEYGEELILWDYPTDVIAIFPPLSSINLIMIPLIYSLIYQYFKEKKSFIYASVATSAVICFVLEPIFSWVGLYQQLKWQYYYSFILYILVAICIKPVVIKIYSVKEKYDSKFL